MCACRRLARSFYRTAHKRASGTGVTGPGLLGLRRPSPVHRGWLAVSPVRPIRPPSGTGRSMATVMPLVHATIARSAPRRLRRGGVRRRRKSDVTIALTGGSSPPGAFVLVTPFPAFESDGIGHPNAGLGYANRRNMLRHNHSDSRRRSNMDRLHRKTRYFTTVSSTSSLTVALC